MSLDFFSSLDAKLSARSTWMPNVDSLDFVNDPTKSRPHQLQTPDQLRQPNVGLYALTATPKNHIFLEYESRLCNILNTVRPALHAALESETAEVRRVKRA